MNQKTNNRMQMLTAMAIFIAAVFIWGIVQWQATGVKECRKHWQHRKK